MIKYRLFYIEFGLENGNVAVYEVIHSTPSEAVELAKKHYKKETRILYYAPNITSVSISSFKLKIGVIRTFLGGL